MFNLIAAVIAMTGASGGQIYISTSVPSVLTPVAGVTRLAYHLVVPDVVTVAQAQVISSTANVTFYANAACPNIKVGISRVKISKN